MADAGRTLLSQWVKKPAVPHESKPPDTLLDAAVRNSNPDEISLPDQQATARHAVEDASQKRAKTASSWSSIFSRPKKVPVEAHSPGEEVTRHEAVIEDLSAVPPSIGDRTANDISFMHTFRASSERLREVSTAKPSLIHVLRVPPEKLREIKPRVHEFFAKRSTKQAGKGLKPNNMRTSQPSALDAPWAVEHIRPERTWPQLSVPKRRKLDKTQQRGISLDSFTDPPDGFAINAVPRIHRPRRELYESDRIRAIVTQSQSKRNGSANDDLLDISGMPKSFDLGEFEELLWYEKYAPRRADQHIHPQGTLAIASWLNETLQTLSSKHRVSYTKRKRHPLDDFVVEDDSENVDDVLVVHGQCGSGKTSAVYAAAASCDAFVFEVNASMKRNGRELSGMLDGIGQNHAVHKAKNVVILIDDGDVIYENEAATFWSVLSRFASQSRRPVIITCSDPSLLALPSTLNIKMMGFNMPDLVRTTDIAWSVALSEGHMLDKQAVAGMVVGFRGDIRKVLIHLQFWCQMGISTSATGLEWLPKQFEYSKGANRVISVGTWFESPPNNERHENDDFSGIGLSNALERLESRSKRDSTRPPSAVMHKIEAEETVSGNGALELSDWYDDGTEPAPAYAKIMRGTFADGYVAVTRDSDVALDVAPYVRHIVASDLRREMFIQSHMEEQSYRGLRMTKRILSTNGIDTRSYLGYSSNSLNLILRTGFPSQLF